MSSFSVLNIKCQQSDHTSKLRDYSHLEQDVKYAHVNYSTQFHGISIRGRIIYGSINNLTIGFDVPHSFRIIFEIGKGKAFLSKGSFDRDEAISHASNSLENSMMTLII